MLHLKARVPRIDMAFEDLSHVKGTFYGLVGQFYGKGITLQEEDNGQRAMMRIWLLSYDFNNGFTDLTFF